MFWVFLLAEGRDLDAVAEVIQQLGAEGIEVTVAAVDIGCLIGLGEIGTAAGPALGQVTLEQGLAMIR